MSADILREAAALMRSRAGSVEAAAVPTPWRALPRLDSENFGWVVASGVVDADYDNTVAVCSFDFEGGTSQHIASWHPTVALAVADWLEAEAGAMDAMDIFTAATATETHSFNVRGAAISVSTDVRGGLQLRADTSSPALIVARAYLGASS